MRRLSASSPMSLLLGGLATAVLLFGSTPAHSGPSYSSRDLHGEYYITFADIRDIGGQIEHCSSAGTLIFDGIGRYRFAITTRCSPSGVVTETGIESYEVDPDGTVRLLDASAGNDPTHGQIVDRGRMILLDSTTRTDPELLLLHGVVIEK